MARRGLAAVGLMSVQAGAAAAQLTTDPQRARVALDRVLAIAADTRGELDRLLGAVGGSALGGGTTPSGRYAEAIAALVDRMRTAGLQVALRADAVPAGDAGAAVHRIVQEALTNALRYSPGSHVTVRIDTGPDALVVDIDDDGPGPRAHARQGYGLVGIAERVRHLRHRPRSWTPPGQAGTPCPPPPRPRGAWWMVEADVQRRARIDVMIQLLTCAPRGWSSRRFGPSRGRCRPAGPPAW